MLKRPSASLFSAAASAAASAALPTVASSSLLTAASPAPRRSAGSLSRLAASLFSSTPKTSAVADESASSSSSSSSSDDKLSQSYSVPFPADTFNTHHFPEPPRDTTVTGKELMDMFRTMVQIRRLETASDQLYKSKMIRGFCHLSTGQEAVATGMESAISRDDAIITAYRCHGFTLTRGATPKAILAELMGRVDGTSRGKGGSMHMFAHEFYGGNGIVGAQVPLGAGIALAQKYKGTNTMTFALYGDGAANQGQVFEAYNMAKLWSLPVVFGCENNHYGMGTAAARAAASILYYTRGDYIPGLRVNGMDALAVREACRAARTWTLEGNGPLVMEFVTYRYGGHSMSDPGTTYRTREEIQTMRSTRDPITGLRHRILDLGVADEDALKAVEKEVKAEIDRAVEEAKASPEPPVEDLYKHVYVEGTEVPYLRGCEPFTGERFN
ncbi:dehydrogenase E1 component-domain-containing protein [Zopfochytrium polystomum]|nr:dehydrogenase E1 component-domain-containing protein [Zopfochytrium polystomum]